MAVMPVISFAYFSNRCGPKSHLQRPAIFMLPMDMLALDRPARQQMEHVRFVLGAAFRRNRWVLFTQYFAFRPAQHPLRSRVPQLDFTVCVDLHDGERRKPDKCSQGMFGTVKHTNLGFSWRV